MTITPDQQMLLRAALDQPDRALRCFSDWWDNTKLENSGSTEYRLLPLVHHNIGRLIPDAATAARVRGVAKHVWLSNQLNAALAAAVLERLNAADIPTLLLKGSAMMVAVSEDNTRLMGDCDVLVQPDQAPRAFQALEELGLTAPRDVNRLTATDYKRVQGLPLIREGKQNALIDIHWRPLRDVRAEGLTREFFEHAVPCTFLDRPTRRPCFPHMLLHVIMHGTEWALVPRYDWFADAALILRKAGPDFDWDLFAETAARYRLGSIIRRGLNDLVQTLDLPVPAKAFTQLPRGSFIDRSEVRWRYRSPDRMPLTRRSIMALQTFRRRDLQSAGKPAWAVLPDIWRSIFGPPPGALLQPTMAADSKDYAIYLAGWHEPEQGGRWTSGSLAVVAIQRAPRRNGSFLRIVGQPMPPASGEAQVINIYSGWRRLGRLTWQVPAGKICCDIIPLPPALSRREVLTLQFHIVKPTSPAEIGPSEDIRQLGIFLQDIQTLSPCTRDAAKTPLEFHGGNEDLAVLWSGWSQPEAEGCWSDGPDASLRWNMPVEVPQGANLVVRGTVFASEDDALRGSISINGWRAGDFVQPAGTALLSVPMTLPPGQREIHVQLQFDNPKSPHQVGVSDDRRKLALLLRSISIEA